MKKRERENLKYVEARDFSDIYLIGFLYDRERNICDREDKFCNFLILKKSK